MRDREMYASREVSKEMMKKDGGMIAEAWNEPCLLPTHVISKEWSAEARSNIGYIGGDLYTGVQKQMKEDSADFARIRSPKKY